MPRRQRAIHARDLADFLLRLVPANLVFARVVYNRDHAVRLRDVPFLTHPKPQPAGASTMAEAIKRSLPNQGTSTGDAVRRVNGLTHDRLIVITDEQSQQAVPPPAGRGSCVNVASARPGLGHGAWHHIDGWSDAVLTYVREHATAAAS